MKMYSMLTGAVLIMAVNLYGLLISTIIQPVTPGMLATSLIFIAIVVYVEFNKRRVLLDNYQKQSFLMFFLVILCQIYNTIMSLALLVYLNLVQSNPSHYNSLRLTGLAVGLTSLSITQVEALTLPYYFCNFFLFMYYIRCYYVMFWRENIVFIFRYLKRHVNFLNQALLAYMPKNKAGEHLKDMICSLCLQNFRENEDVTKLHCQHEFHFECIKVWVIRSNCCPLCRKKVIYY